MNRTDQKKIKILFLCTGNSCRSQMAEGWARYLKDDVLDVCSAGIEKHGLNPLAVKVMAEVGVDIGRYRSKTIEDLAVKEFDYVVTVCDHAHESCPLFPGKARIIHLGLQLMQRMKRRPWSTIDEYGIRSGIWSPLFYFQHDSPFHFSLRGKFSDFSDPP